MLKEEEQLRGGKDWVVIAALVPDRMKSSARIDGIPLAAVN
jgi:hypothetical protein